MMSNGGRAMGLSALRTTFITPLTFTSGIMNVAGRRTSTSTLAPAVRHHGPTLCQLVDCVAAHVSPCTALAATIPHGEGGAAGWLRLARATAAGGSDHALLPYHIRCGDTGWLSCPPQAQQWSRACGRSRASRDGVSRRRASLSVSRAGTA